MEARLRNLFSKRSTEIRQLNLKAQPYESTVKSQSPVKGTRPIAGNGPYRLENATLQSQWPDGPEADAEAEAPDVPRGRRNSYSYPHAGRPLTAPQHYQPAQFESYGRTHSGFSARTSSPFTRRVARDSSPSRYYAAQAKPRVRSVRSISALSSTSQRSQYIAAHVDILDAASQIKPSHETYTQRAIASGKRDYGEDVADRNIAEYGGTEIEPAYGYAAASTDSEDDALDDLDDVVELHSRKELDTWDGLIGGGKTSRGSDGTGDDTRPLSPPSQRDKYRSSQIYYTPPPTANPHSRRESGTFDYSANAMRGLRRSRKSSLASTDAAPTIIPSARSSVLMSASGYFMSGGLTESAINADSIRGRSSKSHTAPEPEEESWGSAFPPHPAVAPVASSRQRASQQFISNPQEVPMGIIFPPHPAVAPTIPPQPRRAQDDQPNAYDPAPILTSQFSKRSAAPTPPISPTTGESPATSISRSSSEMELSPAPEAAKRQPRGGSASYSALRPQESGRNSKASVRPPTISSERSDSTVQLDDYNRDGCAIRDSSNPPPLDTVINTGKSTDIEVIKTHLPAVVHEHVTPTVHHVKQERITREIHNHDVFHRIQPIIDVEVLPTKHYVRAPSRNGLIEIPESALSGRHTKWNVQPIDEKLVDSASFTSEPNYDTLAKDPNILSAGEPKTQDKQKTSTDEGFAREDTFWRHPPQLESGAREIGQTVPLQISHCSSTSESTNDYWDATSIRSQYAPTEAPSTNADGEEDLIFRDSDMAFDGRLPGLEDFNPAVTGPENLSSRERQWRDDEGIGEATKAVRRRQAELNRKMGMLSVNEE